MRVGINGTGLVQRASIEKITDHAAQAAEDGFASYWLAEHVTGGFDALTVLALVGQRVQGIELGTAVVPTFPRHPMVLAGQALTVQQALGGRLTLGVGLCHEVMLAQLGIGFEKPIRHLREYLSILVPLLNEGKVAFQGEVLQCNAEIFRPPETACPVVVAAMGPQALRVAGAHTEGTTLAWVGPRTVREHVAPTLQAAADKVGRPAPRIIATLPVCVTDDPDRLRGLGTRTLAHYGELPSYRAMFEREGVAGPADLALFGSEDQVLAKLEELAASGVTDFGATEFATNDDEKGRTRTLLKAAIHA